ncbi:YhcG family protein [Candidatus Tisiphia endosymbiont of Ptychoptera albimana]|uniref:PDDEXK nuclease domain-containing protein n=1 Tax=Candidatus Tisiphia endosymbiont of Ptychoptera albimana TaxID=3066260 RepID=UPI00312C8AF9
MNQIITNDHNSLIEDIKLLITQAKNRIARVANSEMTMVYWHVGKRIKEEILKDQRAEYGKQVVQFLAQHLSLEYGKSFSRISLVRMIQFYDHFSNIEISSTLSNQLSWSHIIELLPLKEQNQREFYAYMCIQGNWSVRQLRTSIHRMIYERSELSKKSEKHSGQILSLLKSNNELVPELVLKDPYILEFLNLPDAPYESDLESAILQQIEQFILELGTGVSFVARQRRMTIDNEHFYLDLLMYNRKLKRLVAIELKTGKFKAEYKGQMELYINWLKKYETFEGENPPIGIILCTEKSHAQIELLDVSASGIHVAEYWTELPPIKVFEKKIQEIVLQAKNRYDQKAIEIKKH